MVTVPVVDTAARSIRQYKAHTFNFGDVKIIRIGRDLVDVFTGNGWANRSRYRLINGRWGYMSGIRLNAIVLALLPRGR